MKRIAGSSDVVPRTHACVRYRANADGHLYAFDDTFSHLGCSLGKGTLEGTTVTCPCHGSKLDVTSGAVIRGPATRPVRSRMVQVEGEDLLATAE